MPPEELAAKSLLQFWVSLASNCLELLQHKWIIERIQLSTSASVSKVFRYSSSHMMYLNRALHPEDNNGTSTAMIALPRSASSLKSKGTHFFSLEGQNDTSSCSLRNS